MDYCNKKRIFQINVTANWGSTGRIAEGIGRQVILNGWESYIAYGRQVNDSISHLIRIGSKWDVIYHGLISYLLDRQGLASKKATRKLIKNIEDVHPDIIHLHNIHGYYLNYKILFDYLREIEIPVVWTLHDCWSFTGHCAYYSYVKCDKWKKKCEYCANLQSYPKSWGIDRSSMNYSEKKQIFTSLKKLHLIPVSHWLAGDIMHSFLSKFPTKVICNGVDVKAFSPTIKINWKSEMASKFVILGVANIWESRKGLQDFLLLSKQLSEDCIIILLGLKKQQMVHLPSNIKGIVRTQNIQSLVDLYSTADVFINPTWEDNFPTTNLEALACGTPVITYCTGGSVEAVDERSGFVVDQGDIKGLISSIEIIKRNGKSFYASACRERALKLYNQEDRYTEYIQLYKEILNIK